MVSKSGESPTVDVSRNADSLKREITTLQALGISFHQIVGGGVVTLTGVAIAITGGGVPIAYLLAAFAILLVSVPMATLGATMPVLGGNYTYATRLIHPLVGFANLWLFLLNITTMSLYGLSAGIYLQSLDPWFDPTVVAVTMITVFAVANFFGAAFSSRVGILLAVVMLVAFGAFIVMGLADVRWDDLPPALPDGLPGLLQAAALLTFATGGASVVAELGREMKTPGRSIPIAVIGGTLFAGVLYVLIAIPAVGVLPIDDVAGQPLSIVAKTFMPGGWWHFFLVGGAVLAVVGTMNASLLWGSKGILAAVDDGWFPRGVGAVNKRFGTPHWLLLILYVLGVVPAFAGIEMSVIASAASFIGQAALIVTVIASVRVRYLRPDLYAVSPFKVAAWLHWTLTVVGVGFLLYQMYLLQQNFTRGVWIAAITWIAAGAAWGLVRYGKVKRVAAARAAGRALDGPEAAGAGLTGPESAGPESADAELACPAPAVEPDGARRRA
ncbi:APC family permease [Streptomyces sp. NPDC095613]|uniref:APC family permease n=1 Tax=Streptomyces sp. NPDC095613 TaxID=3155540 RepID=UPI003318E7CA